jgi:DNA-binding NarL/FixJ family response regulator
VSQATGEILKSAGDGADLERDVVLGFNGGSSGAAAAIDGGRAAAFPRIGPLRVVIADDDPLYWRGRATLLEQSGIELVVQLGNGVDVLMAVEKAAPDVVVMDLSMPGLTGAEVTRRLIERPPPNKVLVVSVSAQERDVTAAILAGASGYVLKDAPVEEVVAGIRAAAAGESPISPRIGAMLMRKLRDREASRPKAPQSPLSTGELNVLRLVAEGKANAEIAEALFMGQATVRHHVSSILTKLRVENRVQAAVQAVHNRLV